jgi:hypothetical protein
MVSTSWIRSRNFVLLLVLITLAGCGAGTTAKAKVKGRVKFFDKYLTAGTVSFLANAGGQTGSANIDFDGNYEMADAPVGDVKITVKVPTLQSGPGGGPPKAPAGIPPMREPGGDGGMASTPPAIDPKKIVQIPVKYGKADTSGLTYTVQKGEQTYNITLSP